MKKICILIALSLMVSSFFLKAKSQQGSLYVRHWYCCKCDTLFKKENLKPQEREKMGRRSDILCPDCQKKFGDLQQALEKLKEENRQLLDKMKAYQKNANLYNSKLTDALIKTYGQEAGHGNWTLSGFNSSLGKFTVASASLLSDLQGAGLPYKIAVDVIATLQTSNTADAATNVGGTTLDILSSDGIIVSFENEMIRNAALKFVTEMRAAQKLRGSSYQQAVFQAKKNFIRESRFTSNFSNAVKKADFGSTLYDIYSFIQAGAELISDLTDIYESYRIREESLKEIQKAQDQIEENVGIMGCIKSTLDWQNSGGAYIFPGNSNAYSFTLMINILVGRTIQYTPITEWYNPTNLLKTGSDEIFWEIDTVKVKSAIAQLKQEKTVLESMIQSFSDEVVPFLAPWIIKQWHELKWETQSNLLKGLKSPLDALISKGKSLRNRNEMILENLSGVVVGQEIFYFSENRNEKEIKNIEIPEKWSTVVNNKIKPELGRMNLLFPPNAEWGIDFYSAENKFITNKSKAGKQLFHDLSPGSYTLKINAVPVENVVVEKGKETILKVGFLHVVSKGDWEIKSPQGKFYTSFNKPTKIVLPVGSYILSFNGKPYPLTITEKLTLNFELPVSALD